MLNIGGNVLNGNVKLMQINAVPDPQLWFTQCTFQSNSGLVHKPAAAHKYGTRTNTTYPARLCHSLRFPLDNNDTREGCRET